MTVTKESLKDTDKQSGANRQAHQKEDQILESTPAGIQAICDVRDDLDPLSMRAGALNPSPK